MQYNYQQYIDATLGQISQNIKRLPDNAFIPNDPDNSDWQAYQAWLDAGNIPQPFNPA